MIWRPSIIEDSRRRQMPLRQLCSFVLAYFIWDKFRRFAVFAAPIRVNTESIVIVVVFLTYSGSLSSTGLAHIPI